MIYIGCAGWNLSRPSLEEFPVLGSHLQRYATRLNAVEVNSSFYRSHRPQTYARWAASVPEGFRFSVKAPQTITHERRLMNCETPLKDFLEQCGQLEGRLGCILLQLPPSLQYEAKIAQNFFELMRKHYAGPLALEPRHPSWRDADAKLSAFQIAQVGASPPRFGDDEQPSGWPGMVYWRLHGVPRTYYSSYPKAYLQRLSQRLEVSRANNVPTWCIFDNTTSGAALGNALMMQALLNPVEAARQRVSVAPSKAC
ncbi:DUF72 domain-containing protein [Pseudomonas sp. BT-42-2]|jgi:uncharacterized protein YecE (DUF72 family)|uniref:DUF72 domain-containing protein n=1 Tax=Pseudomonas TaxID=286 RepID=UPI0021F6A633|nr:DUF72 domain-containing protein [Pseudomonas sp. BT-42-2]MCV9917944.1 DUF72 domain-containing protein [Pseudomonas sp. BT-42-2]